MPDIMLESIYRGIGERIAKRRQEWHVTQSALSQKTHLPIGLRMPCAARWHGCCLKARTRNNHERAGNT